MKESFLHYLWQFKKFSFSELQTTEGLPITIVHSGNYLQQAGPDFFNAQLIIGTQRWAGSVEIHLKSSDWYVHHHETDAAYNNVILHVVWEHDTDVFRKNNTEIPVLELKNYVDAEILSHYQKLLSPKNWINCENELSIIDSFTLSNWKEKLFLERIEERSDEIEELLVTTANDWEAVFFLFLAKSFGLNVNGIVFFELMQSIPYEIIRKEQSDIVQLEALFLGRAGLLETDKEDVYFKELKKRWNYLQQKYQLPEIILQPVHFFKLRPDNFPTIRLAQLAQLISQEPQLFHKCMHIQKVSDFYQLVAIAPSVYWQSHYVFDRQSASKRKKLSKSFIDLVIINALLPFLFAFHRYQNSDSTEQLLALASQIEPEKNVMIDKFLSFGLTCNTSYDTQALLQLKKQYCDFNRCLSCAIGQKLINFTIAKQ
jgi:hypothetical protein